MLGIATLVVMIILQATPLFDASHQRSKPKPSGPTAEEIRRKIIGGAAEKLFDNCQRFGKSYDPRC